ncbi:MAG: hypothetical protein ACR2RD_15070 [Woeseiaceae bacterium]
MSPIVLISAIAVLSACVAQQPTIEYLDELTGITITHSRTPFVLSTEMSTDTAADAARDYVQIGAIEVNRMGALSYFLWLGISEVTYSEPERQHPEGFESIVFAVGDEGFQLDIAGWTEGAIGASEPVYRKLFRDTVDAYYVVTTEQMQRLADEEIITFRTVDPSPKKYVSWYQSDSARGDLTEFLTIVAQ